MKSPLRAVAGALLSSTLALAQEDNSTFESPDISQGTGTYYGDALVWYQAFNPGAVLDGWIVTDGSIDIVRHITGTALAGAQSLDLNGLSAGTLTRSFATEPGARYRLAFDFSGNPVDGCVRELEVRWNGAVAATFAWDPTVKGNSFQDDMKWERKSVELQAAGTNSVVELASIRPGASGPEIDNIAFAFAQSVTIESAVLLSWPIPEDGPLGAILEAADQAGGPWRVVRPTLLNLTAGGKVAVTIPAADAAKFYRLRPGTGN